MEKWVKWGIGLIGGGFLANTIVSASRLSRFSKEFQLSTSVRVHELTFQSLTIAVDCVFKNPTDARLTLKHPTVLLYDRNPTLGGSLPTPIQTSTIQANQYPIKPNSETPINPILLKISFLDSTFLSAAWGILKAVLAGQPVTLWVRALSQVNKTIPVVQVQSITINGKKKTV